MVGQRPTVGDTITVVRWVAAPPGAVLEARPPADSSIATLAAPPVLVREGDSVRVTYSLALWAPGSSDLTLPGVIVVRPDGQVDTLADFHQSVTVASVLPGGRDPKSIAPMRPSTWIPHGARSVLPFAVIIPLALVVIALLQWRWWRRPRTVPPAAVPPTPHLTTARVDAWIAAGESRLVLDFVAAMTRDQEDFADWRARADALRFALAHDPELAALAREGVHRIGRDRAAAS